MAVYKVAQDVEADDKLLGPFTARQFIYLIIVALSGLVAWFLSQLFLPLMIIPMPVILFFGVLALPLRKDQPMEVYMAAMVSFYLKPRRRLWVPDGIESLVEITAPQAEEVQRTKDYGQDEAQQRLSYLADIVDSEGWAVRRVNTSAGATSTSMISDVYNDAQSTVDPLDDSGTVAQGFESMIAEADERRRSEIMARMRNPDAFTNTAPVQVQPTIQTQPVADPYSGLGQAATEPHSAPFTQQPTTNDSSQIKFNPYPNIHQSVIQPLDTTRHATTTQAPVDDTTEEPETPEPSKSTSETTVSPDIIKLVNNSDLSIETIAREAQRIHKKDDEEEVVISLR